METILQTTRRVLRGLARSPGFTVSVLATLGLGFAATAAIFTVLNAVVLNPLPYPDAERLVAIGSRVPRLDPEARWGVSPAGYFHYRARSRTLEEIGIYRTYRGTVTGAGEPARARLALVSAPLFSVLRARPAVGRLIGPEDDRPGAEPVVVLGHAFWTARYGADPRVVGSVLELDGSRVRVAGVLERGVELPGAGGGTDLWMAERLDPGAEPQNWHAFTAIGRLREGATAAGAQAELERLTARFGDLFPGAYSPAFLEETGFAVGVASLRDEVVGDSGRTLWVLFAAVGLVLLIACADVANLFLVRTEGRRREVAIRAAMGATSVRLARGFVAEGLVLGLLSGAVGVVLTLAGVRALVALAPEHLPRVHEIRVGPETLAFTAALAVGVGVAVGLLPLLRFRADPAGAVREAGRGSTPAAGRTLAESALVVGQVATALVLLAAAGLMFRTYERLRAVEPGFDPRGVLTMELTLPSARYTTFAATGAFYEELTRRVAALPGVRSAGVATALPLSGAGGCNGLYVEDRPEGAQGEPLCVTSVTASPEYFRTLGIPVRGRVAEWADVNRRSGEVVVTRALAERLWPGEDPIGKGVRARSWEQPFYRVVGVAEDVRADGLHQPPAEAVFYPMLPMREAPLWAPPLSMSLVIRADRDEAALAGAIRGIVSAMDREVPIANVQPMERIVERSMADTSFTLLLLGITAAAALAMGAMGLYGVLAHLVGQRRSEIAIRMAMGARKSQVAGLVLRRSLLLALAGVALGLAGAVSATHVLRSLLFETTPTEPLVLGGAALLLLGIAALASLTPAARAARIDPMVILRHD